jgi:hypothetical protein
MYLLLLLKNALGTYNGKKKKLKKQTEEIEIGSPFFICHCHRK